MDTDRYNEHVNKRRICAIIVRHHQLIDGRWVAQSEYIMSYNRKTYKGSKHAIGENRKDATEKLILYFYDYMGDYSITYDVFKQKHFNLFYE